MAQNSVPIPFLRVVTDIGRERAYALIDKMSDATFNAMADKASQTQNARSVMVALSSGRILQGFEEFFIDDFVLPPIVDVNSLAEDEPLALAVSNLMSSPYRMAAAQFRDQPGFSDMSLTCAILGSQCSERVKQQSVLVESFGCRYADKNSPELIYRPDCCSQHLQRFAGGADKEICDGALPGLWVIHKRDPHAIVFAGLNYLAMSRDKHAALTAARNAHLDASVPGVTYLCIDYKTGTLHRVSKSKWRCDIKHRPPSSYPTMVREGLTTLMATVTADLANHRIVDTFPAGLPTLDHLAAYRNSHQRGRRPSAVVY